MSGFSFGSNNPVAGGGAFGTPGLGQTNATNPVQNTGFSFGAPAPNAGFNFGAPGTQPAAPVSSGFNFSAPATTTAAPPFGGFGIVAPTIAPASSTAFSGFAPPAQSLTPAFGSSVFGKLGANTVPTTSVTPAFNAFSTPTTASSAPGFSGLATATTTPGFGGFGSSAVTTAVPTLGGFGVPSTSTPTLGGFGVSTTTALGGFAVPQNTTATLGAFGAVPITTPTLGGFGATTFTAPTLAKFSVPLKPALSGFTGPSPVTVAPSIGTTSVSLNFGTTTTSTPTFGATTVAGGLFNTKSNLNQPQISSGMFVAPLTQPSTLPLTATTVAPAPSLGLGGTDLNASQPKSSEGKQDNIKVKDIIIPAPIAETVENIKSFIKQQKSYSSDIARSTIRKLSNVSNDIQSLEWSLQQISNCVDKNYSQIKLLRGETSTAIQSVEMAQRTHETPVGLQFENLSPLQYFQELIQKYESDMLVFRNEVELTEKHMMSLTNPQSFSSEDLKRGLQQIHESFIALAGRLHEIHQKVENQKEHFLNLRKYYLRDSTNVFLELETNNQELGVSNISSGPTPFSSLTAAAAVSWQNRSNASRNLGGFNVTNAGAANQSLISSNEHSGMIGGGGQGPLFGGSSFGTTSGQSFNLQTPPLGAKRNKQ